MSNKKPKIKPDILPEYDLRGKKGVRGKYYQAYRQGHTVEVVQADGTVTTQYFTLEDGAVMLEPDVKQYFPDSDAVNRALRVLITAVPVKPAVPRKSISKQRAVSKA
jgi:hypothetical protein